MRWEGAAPFTRLATRRQKSRLSIVISTSGFAASTASAVSAIRRFNWRYLGSTSASPITDSSAMGNREARPWPAISGPPIPS